MPTVKMALGRLREQAFTVYLAQDPNIIILRSPSAIARIDIRTGEGIYNPHGQYCYDLEPRVGARQVRLAKDQIARALEVAVPVCANA